MIIVWKKMHEIFREFSKLLGKALDKEKSRVSILLRKYIYIYETSHTSIHSWKRNTGRINKKLKRSVF